MMTSAQRYERQGTAGRPSSRSGSVHRTSHPTGKATDPPPIDPVAVGPDADAEAVARTILLERLAAQPRSRAELAQVLAKKNVPESVATRMLDRFEEVGLVDDAAFARAWVQSRQVGRGLGRRALAQELRRRGLAPEVISAALEEVDEDSETDAARRLVRRKLAASRRLDHQVRVRRLVGMLGRKGYTAGLAMRVVLDELAAERSADAPTASPPADELPAPPETDGPPDGDLLD